MPVALRPRLDLARLVALVVPYPAKESKNEVMELLKLAMVAITDKPLEMRPDFGRYGYHDPDRPDAFFESGSLHLYYWGSYNRRVVTERLKFSIDGENGDLTLVYANEGITYWSRCHLHHEESSDQRHPLALQLLAAIPAAIRVKPPTPR